MSDVPTFADLDLRLPLARRLAHALGIERWPERPHGPAMTHTITFRHLLRTPGVGPKCAIRIADRCEAIGYPIPDPDGTRFSPRMAAAERRMVDEAKKRPVTAAARRRAAIRGLYRLGSLRIETDVGHMKLSEIAKMLEKL